VRLFVALEIPSTVRDNFTSLMNRLRAVDWKSTAKMPRWVRPQNLHVTLKFIGEAAPEKLDQIRGALAGVHSEQPLELRFRGLGFFPDPKRPRVFWAGVLASPNLTSIAADIDQRLAGLEIPGEQRSFTPHLTLARLEPPGVSTELLVAVEKDASHDFGVLRTNQFHLIESKLKPSGAEYTTLDSFLFAAET
jgi:RNA 2',3'-cyclic 3'-phosphodiesterase